MDGPQKDHIVSDVASGVATKSSQTRGPEDGWRAVEGKPPHGGGEIKVKVHLVETENVRFEIDSDHSSAAQSTAANG